MANTISTRAPIAVQFTGSEDMVASPCNLVANRQYTVVDYTIVVTTGSGDGADGGAGVFNQARVRIRDIQTAATVELGTVNATVAGAATWHRPAVSTLPGTTAAPTDALITTASSVVARGETLRLDAAASGTAVATAVRASGVVFILPGNRYSATTIPAAYYANNAASGAQGSAATQNI